MPLKKERTGSGFVFQTSEVQLKAIPYTLPEPEAFSYHAERIFQATYVGFWLSPSKTSQLSYPSTILI